MEEIKKRQILKTAMDIFKEKGYFAASMQEIAEACGMAKASIYKVFPSKEDLFTGVFADVHRTMFEEARELDRVLRLEGEPPKEILRRKIEFQLQYMLENYFFTSEFKELPVTENENFQNAWRKKRADLLSWHRDCFREAYGEAVAPYLWDVVAIFRGMLKEYLSHANQHVIGLPMSELAGFLAGRIDAVVNELLQSKPDPVLKESGVYFNDINPADFMTKQESLKEFLHSFSRRIAGLQSPEPVRRELLEVVSLLQQQLDGEESPNPTLVKVYVSYLDSVSDLSPYVRQLNLMLSQMER
ncbi:TetR/AcrR family transcriptional regulator [Paenibacillus sp. M1]|uniref:TetR/AcrR family transcriptional regulator n=1 Tax=Paenibacillus haidiansis TaxID=1574488 RepID=A0ABU7VW87_9BACL